VGEGYRMTELPPIGGFLPVSLVDWPGHVTSVIFTKGCNFRCGYCGNVELVLRPETLPDVDISDILYWFRDPVHGPMRDAVTITGGEPTIHPGLPDLCQLLKAHRLKVKLDTNGTNPGMLRTLIRDGLVDAVYMDVKAPIDAVDYAHATNAEGYSYHVWESVEWLAASCHEIEAVYRTTVFPGRIWELDEIAVQLPTWVRWIIQPFRVPPGGCLDPEFDKIKPFPPERFEEIKRMFERKT
jgi:pyruvate formate lyase activating enzyme